MAITAGTISQVAVTATTVDLLATAVTGATGPTTYQWYRSTTSGFTPGGGNILTGKTALALHDTGLSPNTTYYYKLVATDTGAGNAQVTYTQQAVVTAIGTPFQNSFGQQNLVGLVDLHLSINTISVQIDQSQATPLYYGAPVKLVDSIGGIPKVIGCTADTDEVYGFLNYDVKTAQFTAGKTAEMSLAGNCMYLYAMGVIGRGKQVTLNMIVGGNGQSGVSQAVGSSGKTIVGWALDASAASGTLIRVMLGVPSFKVA